MGRSVSVPGDAALTIYFPFEGGWDEDDQYDADLAGIYWVDMVDDIQNAFRSIDDSFEDADEWRGNEMHLISKGDRAFVILCEYMGFCSLSLVPVEEPPEDKWYGESWYAFAAQWITDNGDKIRQAMRDIGLQTHVQVGRFSNGESVYRAQ